MYDRKVEKEKLLMDGIAVRADYRGLGIGARLLDEIIGTAETHDCKYVRLDVIDINRRAKVFYERKGFETISVERFKYLRWLLGFAGVDKMQLKVAAR